MLTQEIRVLMRIKPARITQEIGIRGGFGDRSNTHPHDITAIGSAWSRNNRLAHSCEQLPISRYGDYMVV